MTPSQNIIIEAPTTDEELDENEMYLRYLDTDTSEIINNLKSKVNDLELQTISLQSSSNVNKMKYEEVELQLQREMEFQKDRQEQTLNQAIIVQLINEIISDVSTFSGQKVLEQRIAELEHQVEVKEAEVLWV